MNAWAKGNQKIIAPKLERQDWGVILNYFRQVLTALNRLPIPIIWVCHATITKPTTKRDKDSKELVIDEYGSFDIEIDGSIKRALVNSCSIVMCLVEQPIKNAAQHALVQSRRLAIMQRTTIDGVSYPAKDRHNIIGSIQYEIMAEKGVPVKDPISYMFERYLY
jgi:hypothetical protein